MSMLAPVPDVPDDQVTLPISFPKEKERYDLNGKGLMTETTLAPRMQVTGTFRGAVAKLSTDFLADSGKWVIIVDDCEITPS